MENKNQIANINNNKTKEKKEKKKRPKRTSHVQWQLAFSCSMLLALPSLVGGFIFRLFGCRTSNRLTSLDKHFCSQRMFTWMPLNHQYTMTHSTSNDVIFNVNKYRRKPIKPFALAIPSFRPLSVPWPAPSSHFTLHIYYAFYPNLEELLNI